MRELDSESMSKERPFSRRDFMTKAAVFGAAATMAPSLLASTTNPPIKLEQISGLSGMNNVKNVRFKHGNYMLAGHLHLPAGFRESGKYRAIVVVHPGGGIKEQTAGLYAQQMAAQGFIALAFDASHQGESGGEPRLLENPAARVEDIHCAVDYLTTLSYVDADSIGALGICAGSGYTVKAVTTERRIKALATVSAVDTGASARKGWEGTGPVADQLATLQAVAEQRTAEARGAAPRYIEYVPELRDANTHRDMREAHTYYRTSGPGGFMHPNSPNKMLFTSLERMIAFTGFDQVDTLLTQPLLVIAGSEAGSMWHSRELHAKARGPKELFIINGATHMDLYAGAHVEQVVSKLSPFFDGNL